MTSDNSQSPSSNPNNPNNPANRSKESASQSKQPNYSRHWLMAMPGLMDGLFERSAIYICLHDIEGAMGFVMNKPADFTLSRVFDQLDFTVRAPERLNETVLIGGPVAPEQGFVVHDGDAHWAGSKRLNDSLVLSPGKDILQAIAENADNLPDHYQVIFGYSGWTADQLEDEILDNSWHLGDLETDSDEDLDHQLVFTQPIDSRWHQVAYCFGVDISRLSWQIGNA